MTPTGSRDHGLRQALDACTSGTKGLPTDYELDQLTTDTAQRAQIVRAAAAVAELGESGDLGQARRLAAALAESFPEQHGELAAPPQPDPTEGMGPRELAAMVPRFGGAPGSAPTSDLPPRRS